MHYDERDEAWGPVSRAPYKREPYVRATLADGTSLDGKAGTWTRDKVLVTWKDGEDQFHSLWMDAEHVQRIHRDESRWRDPYDDHAHYYPDAPADEGA